MAENFFDLQKFATVADGTVTLSANETYTLDGVDYTAGTSGAVLKADTTDNGGGTYTATAITGINSGAVTTSPTSKTDPAINFVGDDGAFEFTCTVEDDVLNVKKGKSSLNYTTGTVTYYTDKLEIPQGTVGFSGTLMGFLPFNVTMEVPSSGATLAYNSSGGAEFTSTEKLSSKLTFPDGVAEFLETIKPQLPEFLKTLGIEITAEQVDTLYNIVLPIVQDSLQVDLTGTINYTSSPINISFGENTTTDVTIGERTISFETVDDAAGIGFTFVDGVLTLTPGNNDGTLNIALKNGDTTTFSGNLEIAGGSILVDVLKQNISVTAGTTTTFTAPEDLVGSRSIAITAEQATGFDFAIGNDGKVTLTPNDENPLNVTITNGTATVFNRDIALTGSVVVDTENNTLGIMQDTSLVLVDKLDGTSLITTITATDDAGITLAIDDNGVLTLTPGEDDGSLNITRKRDDTLLFDFDLSVSGGSISVDPSSGKVTVAEGTTLEIINNQSGSYTSMAVEGGDASCTLTTNSDGTLALNVESGDGKLHFLHKHDDTTIFDMAVELSGTITFDATDNTITAADGTKLAVAFGDRELTASVNGDAGFGISVDSGIIKLTPGENDGSIDLKLTNGDRTVFEGNVAVSGGGMEINLSEQTLTFDKGVAATITMGDRVFVYSLPNGATQKFVIDDEGKISLSFEDDDPLHVKYTSGTTTILDVDITIDGTVTFDPSANSVSFAKDTTATVDYSSGRSATFTVLDDAGITASVDDDGNLRLAPGDDDGKLNMTITDKDGSTTIDVNLELTGAIVYDSTNQKIYAEAGTKFSISDNQVDIVTELSVSEDAGFTFAFDGDSGKVTITPEDGDGKLTLTRIRDGGERVFSADVEISGGSIIFDSTNNSLTVTEDTKTAITVGDYTLELTVTDEAGITINLDDDGKFIVSAEEGDGELVFTLKKGDTVLNTGSVEFDGTLELDFDDSTVGVLKDTSATFTLGDYKYSITANEAASIKLDNDLGAITVTAPEGDGSLDIALTKDDETVFEGNVEFTGSFTVDPANQKISVSKDSQTKFTVGDYTAVLAVTDEASVDIAFGNGKITLSATEGDGKATLDLLKDGSSLLGGEVELDGEVTVDVNNQSVSVTEGTSLSITRDEITTTITANDAAGFTVTNDDSGKLVFTPGDGDGTLQITRTKDGSTLSDMELEIKDGSIVVDTANNSLSLTEGTQTIITMGDYVVTLTANDANGVEFSVDDGYLVISPQEDGGSVGIKVTNGGTELFDSTLGLSDGSIKLDVDGQKIVITGGTTLSLTQDETTVSLTAKEDTTLSVVSDDASSSARTLYFTLDDGSANFGVTAERSGKEVFSNTVTVGGTISYRASTNTFGLVSGGDSEYSDTESYIGTTTGEYTFKAGTDGETAINSFSVSDDGKITITFPNDEHNGLQITATKSGEELFNGHVNIDGDVTYDSANNKFIVPAETITTVTIGNYSAVLTVDDEAGFTISADNGKVTLTPGDGDGKLTAVVYNSDGDTVLGGTVEVANGSIVLDDTTKTISVTKGTTTTLTIGDYSISLTANDDAGVNFGVEDGKFVITPQDGDGSIDVTYSESGEVAFSNNVEISGGSITVDALNNKVGLTKDTTITLTQSDDSKISVKALDDAAIAISAADGGGVRIAPDSGDGDLQLSVTRDDVTRTATIGIEGAVVYQTGGNISLEEGTTINLGWLNTEGVNTYNLKLTSNGSSGSIAFDAEKGLGVTSADDKLDMELSSPSVENSMKFEGVQGTVWYNSGRVTLVEGTSFQSEGTFYDSDIDIEFEAVGGDVYVDFYTDYVIYSAGTGVFKHTLTDADGNSGTISINKGSLTVGKDTGGFIITEGSDISTSGDSEGSMPLTTGDAGTYILNGHEFVTAVDGVKLTASGDAMVFAASDDVSCDDLSFVGNGNVSITADGDHLYGPGVYIYDEDLITADTTTQEIIDKFTHGFDYGDPITDQDEVEDILENGDRDQVLAMQLDDKLSADFSGDEGYKNVTLGGEYAQSLKFNNDGYNVAVVDEDARGKKDITTGNGGDLVVVEDTKAQVSVTSGTGNDTIVSKGDNVFVSLTGGKDAIYAVDGKMSVAGYNASTGAGFYTKTISTDEIAEAVEEEYFDFADGRLSLDSAQVTFENASEVVALYDRYGDKQLVGFASQDDLLDASDYDEPVLLVGDGNSTLLGGSANDTVLASAGDFVDAGAGRNLIKLPDARSDTDARVNIALIDGDRDTVENFSTGFENHSDKIYLDTDETPEFKFDGTNASVISGGELRGILSDVGDGEDFVEFLTNDDDGDDVKVAVAQKGGVIVAGEELADLYFGENSGVDFSNYEKLLVLDMENTAADEIMFQGINSVMAGSGLTTLVGSANSDTLLAGSGGTRMWSSWGNDLMIGNTDDDKDGPTEFFYLAGDGHDTIRNFEFLTDDNPVTADKLELIDNAVTDAVVNADGDVFLKLADDDDWLAIEGAQGQKFRVNDFVAKVDDKVVTYEDKVDYYVATGDAATMQVNESAEVWLDDPEDKAYVGDFKVIDATKSTGPNTLAGNTDDNTIFGGQGDNSLWGGDGFEGDDVLYGGGGQNAFFYGSGNGSDTIRGANDGDDVVLFGITLEQISSTDITSDGVEIQFTDGGSVKVEGTADVTYHLGDGSKFSADHSQGEWNSK